jgi:hypothetical protein
MPAVVASSLPWLRPPSPAREAHADGVSTSPLRGSSESRLSSSLSRGRALILRPIAAIGVIGMVLALVGLRCLAIRMAG